MPTFCRHNRLIQNCPICALEQHVELRPLVSPAGQGAGDTRATAPRATRTRSRSARAGSGSGGGASGVKVRRLARGGDDGFRSPLVRGLKSSEDASRLAEEIAFAVKRLEALEHKPPGLYAEVAGGGRAEGAEAGRHVEGLDAGSGVEERTWLAFLIAYICPSDGPDPFASIAAIRTTWSSGELPALDRIELGPRTAHDAARGLRTLEAYRAWAARAGTQAQAFTGDLAWSPERRFARVFERLALPGLHRDARFDLLVTLGRLGVYEVRAGSLALGGDNPVTVAAKRALGIGDPMLLGRRAAELAECCQVPLEALDVGLYNWERGERATLGLAGEAEPDDDALGRIEAAFGL